MSYPRIPVARQRGSALAVCLLAALQAQAQQAPSGVGAADVPETKTLDEIVVRGEKTERSLQDTTASVAVTTSVRIEQENLQSLFDILNRTANVSQMYGDRGFNSSGIANEAGAPNPLATIYVDGAALPSNASDCRPDRPVGHRPGGSAARTAIHHPGRERAGRRGGAAHRGPDDGLVGSGTRAVG